MAYKNTSGWKNNSRSRKSGYGAKSRRNTPRRKTRKFNSGSSATELTRLAFKLGQIERGRGNPDSRIADAYNRGKTKPEKRPKKTLF